MTKTTTIIKNGRLRLHATQTDKFKMSRISFNFIAKKDKVRSPLTRLGLAVLMRGSTNYPTICDINKRLDELYDATVSLRNLSFGDKSVFKISCKVIDNKYRLPGDDTEVLDETVKTVSDILFNPLRDEHGLLSKQYFESEKKITIDNINAQINDQRAYASKRCSQLMFNGTPMGYSSMGDVRLLEGFTREQLTENIDDFMRTAAVECYYVGSEDPSTVAEMLGKYFNVGIGRAEEIDYCEVAFTSPRSSVQTECEQMDVSQGRLELGYTCGTVLADSNYYAMALFNEIFGGGSVSKLFINVREKKSLCYYCYSSFHSATGTIRVGCGIKPENKDIALDEIAYQLEQMQIGDFTDTEILTAKRSLISGLKQIEDSAAAIEAFWLRRLVAGVGHTSEDCIDAINAVTKEQIVEAASRVRLDTVYFLTSNGECGEDADDE